MELVKEPSEYPSNDNCLAVQVRKSLESQYRQKNLGYKFHVDEAYMRACISQASTRDLRVTIREVTNEIS